MAEDTDRLDSIFDHLWSRGQLDQHEVEQLRDAIDERDARIAELTAERDALRTEVDGWRTHFDPWRDHSPSPVESGES